MKLIGVILTLTVTMYANDPRMEQSFWEIYTEALRGNPKAQFNTGVIFERGIGTEKDEAKALEWYTKSAESGNVDAQYNLGLMYLSGRGTAKNVEAGKKWLDAAAKQGDKEAEALLRKVADKDQSEAKHEETIETQQQIIPVTLILQNTALICNKPSKQSECRSYHEGLAVTSKIKSGPYFKISGMASTKGWQLYQDEGWIHESDVSEREQAKKTERRELVYNEITPVTLAVNRKTQVCEMPDEKGPCTLYQPGSVVTSTMMSGEYYKISGIATKKGWQPIGLPRWIHRSDVEKR